MTTSQRKTYRNEKGFALLAAMIASLILIAVAMLVINMSVGDVMTSSKMVGTRKAFAAAESAASSVIGNYSPDATQDNLAVNGRYTTTSNCTNKNYTFYKYTDIYTSAVEADDNTVFAICTPVSSGLAPVPVPGNSINSDAAGMGLVRYSVSVIGKNTTYGSTVSIDLGVGFGPVPINN